MFWLAKNSHVIILRQPNLTILDQSSVRSIRSFIQNCKSSIVPLNYFNVRKKLIFYELAYEILTPITKNTIGTMNESFSGHFKPNLDF